jgi:hypothetical protein
MIFSSGGYLVRLTGKKIPMALQRINGELGDNERGVRHGVLGEE